MTQEQFNDLPGLIRLGVFMDITGLNKEDVSALVKTKELRVMVTGKRRRRFFYKADAGKMAGFKL
jgi:hypothetical protein